MNRFALPLLLALTLVSCSEELTFKTESFSKKSSLPCQKDCPEATIDVPIAEGPEAAADSINKKVFATMKEIIQFGENQYDVADYNGLLSAYMKSYETIQKDTPEEKVGWEAAVEGNVIYQSDSIIGIELKHYTFTGGAHGYSGRRSLLFHPETGKSIPETALFRDEKAFRAFAEKKFRQAYGIPAGAPINSTGFMFEGSAFQLPQTYFFTDKGFLLYYNVYEIASYAEGAKEVLIPYAEMKPFLAIR